jgi:hypothetical protein
VPSGLFGFSVLSEATMTSRETANELTLCFSFFLPEIMFVWLDLFGGLELTRVGMRRACEFANLASV